MDKKVKIKNIFAAILFVLTVVILFDITFKPYERINFNFIDKFIEKTRQIQNVAPHRLYINAWRIAKLEYVDSSMNDQNWHRWRTRYSGKINTIEDANVAINTMLASLNDTYTKFLKSKSFSEQKIVLDSKITGVGLMLNKSGDGIVVNHILKNSSAQSQQVMPGDVIVSIDGMQTKDMSLDNIHSYIEGTKEKNIKFIVKRGEDLIIKTFIKRVL